MVKQRVLIADDEVGIRVALGDELESAGFAVLRASDGDEAYDLVVNERPELVVLDVMMPKLDGFALCRRLRAEGDDVPILFLTARAEHEDVLTGLGYGADDYVTKPFRLDEVVARAKAILRRTDGSARARRLERLEELALGPLRFDFKKLEATRDDERLELTARELRVLQVLGERLGEVVTRDELLDAAWGREVFVSSRSVDTQIYMIRQKIEPDPASPRYLLSVRRVGYKLVAPGDDG